MGRLIDYFFIWLVGSIILIMALIHQKAAMEEANATIGYIQLKPETKQKLAELQSKPNETFDEIVNRLIRIAKRLEQSD